MKIKKMFIHNFRIFNGLYELDFNNKDLIIISGPNGNGKSTIFDSIQWCLTGKIPRYDGSNEKQKFNYIMNERIYKTKGSQSMLVEIWLETDEGVTHKIRRSQEKNEEGVLSASEVRVNDETFNMKQGINKIREILTKKGLYDSASGNNNEVNLATFFSSTQLLSQDALHNFIRADKPGQRYELIDKILGIGKYGDDFEKFIDLVKNTVDESCEEISKKLQNPQNELKRLSMEIFEKEKMLIDTGEVTEKDLIDYTKKLIDYIRKSGIDNKEMPDLIEKIDQNLIDKFIKIKQDIIQKKESNESLKGDIINAREFISLTPQTYSDEKNQITSQLRTVEQRNERQKEEWKIVNDRKISFKSLKVRRNTYQKIKESQNALTEEIVKYETELQNILFHEEVIKVITAFEQKDVFINIYERCLEEMDTIINTLKCLEIDREVEELRIGRSEDLNMVSKYKQELKNNDIKLALIRNKINKLESKVSEKKESIVEQLVRQVQGHLVNGEIGNICPVCGVTFESSEILKESVLRKIDEFGKNLTELEKQLLNLKAEESSCMEEIRLTTLKMSNLESEINAKIRKESTLSIEKEKIMGSDSNISIYIEDKNISLTKEEKLTFLSNYKVAFELLKSIQEIEDNISKSRANITLKETLLNTLRSESKQWRKYLDLDEIEIDLQIQKNDAYLTKIAEETIYLDGIEVELRKKLNLLEEKWKQRETVVKEFQEKYNNFVGELTELEKINELAIKELKIFNFLEGEIGKHLTKVYAFLAKDNIRELKIKESELKGELEKAEKDLADEKRFLNIELAALKASHISVRSELTGDYLLQHSDYIDQLFMQISPHAVYRHVQLVPKKKNLYVVMTKHSAKENDLRELSEQELKQQFNASLKFSSAQSNVLALCIFLALNRSQKWTKLKFLGIDDPFQNLDDINIFSFIDVLSQVLLMQQKQVLISTHNEDFAHLIRVKMGLDAEKIGTISFQAYNDEGVAVKGNCVVVSEVEEENQLTFKPKF